MRVVIAHWAVKLSTGTKEGEIFNTANLQIEDPSEIYQTVPQGIF